MINPIASWFICYCYDDIKGIYSIIIDYKLRHSLLYDYIWYIYNKLWHILKYIKISNIRVYSMCSMHGSESVPWYIFIYVIDINILNIFITK